MPGRTAEAARKTNETDISVTLCLDGTGAGKIDTGVGFFDHMLQGFARHGLFDLEVACRGDLQVDTHHTVEDVGIVLGECIKKALGDKAGITRYGSATLPMDEVLVLCATDLGGRPYYASDIAYTVPKLGQLETEAIDEFFRAVSWSAGLNLHFKLFRGGNNHHMAEACFKAFARALAAAAAKDPRVKGIPSTKGAL